MIIMAEEDKSIVLESVHLASVTAMLRQKSIISNIHLSSIQEELVQPTYEPIVIATGKAATPGKDAHLELYFSEKVESQFFEVGGSIDYKNHLQIPSVKKGELIARKLPPIEGIPGYDVFGQYIIPAAPKDIIVAVKSGVEMNPEGEIIAKKEGRPRLTGTKIKTFDISTNFIVSGNVDIETGNIVFSGDVTVYGNVTDNMIIESLGNVYISGSVFNSTITATGSIHVRGNVIGGKLYSGYFGVLFNRLYHTSKILSGHIEKLLAASKILEQALESKNLTVRYSQIVQLLIENKIKEIPSASKELLSVISNIQHINKAEYQKLKEITEIFYQPAKLLETASYSFIKNFLSLLQETHMNVTRMQEDKVRININQCHNSEMKSNGDIIIHREGVLLSDLYSAGNITFIHEFAVCRGAVLEADGMISAKIVGGHTGVKTELKAKKQIDVRKMYNGRVCVGRYCTDISDLVENTVFNKTPAKHRA
jgi:hypothetical protein